MVITLKTKTYLDELRNKTTEELKSALVSAKKELFNLRFQNATNQLNNPERISQVKKTIARIQTIITQKNLKLKKGVE